MSKPYDIQYGWFYGLVVERLMIKFHATHGHLTLPSHVYSARDELIQDGYDDWCHKAPGGGNDLVDAVASTIMIHCNLTTAPTHLELLVAAAPKW